MGSQLPLKRGTAPFLTHVYCGQTAGWMKTPLGTEVELGPGHIVLNGDPAPPRERGTAATPLFSAHVCCGHGRASQLLMSSCTNRVVNTWNNLPNWVSSADTTKTFKTRLYKFWYKEDITYNFSAILQGTGSYSEFLCASRCKEWCCKVIRWSRHIGFACARKLPLRLRLYVTHFLTILSNYNGVTAYNCLRFTPTTAFLVFATKAVVGIKRRHMYAAPPL